MSRSTTDILVLHRAPDVAATVLSLAMAFIVLRAQPRKPANQVLAFFMVLIAGNFAVGFVVNTHLVAGLRLWERIAVQFSIFDPAVLLYFVLLYPRRDARLDRPWVLAAIAGPPLVLTALQLGAPWMFLLDGFRLPGEPTTPLALTYLPLSLYTTVAYLAGLVLLIRNVRAEASPLLAKPLALVMLGVAVVVVPRIGANAADALLQLEDGSNLVLGVSQAWYFARHAVPTVVAYVAIRAVAMSGVSGDRRDVLGLAFRRLGWIVGVLLLVWLVAALTGPTFGPAVFSLRWVFFAVIVGFAVLRYQVFDVEVRVRRAAQAGLAGATLVALVLLALGVASAARGAVDRLDPALVMAVVAVIALAPPTMRWASRQAAARMGRLDGGDPLQRKVEMYRASLAAAVRGGAIPADAEGELRDLRRALGITEEQHGVLVALALQEAGGRRVAAELDGRLAGRYELHDPLGAGAHGRCVLATDVLLGRRVVIKQVPHLGGGEPALLREARAASRLHHPNIVTVFDVFDGVGVSHLVMEFMEGGSLRRALARGRASEEDAVRILRDVLAGLGAAHAKGIVHGDLKPENVLLDADGRAKLADFGSAHSANPQATLGALPSRPGPGTLLYMAPEQVLGEPASKASDLFAVGAVAHELLTGVHYLPVVGLNDLQLREAIVAGAGQPVDLPPPMAAWLRKALAGDSRDRWGSAVEMLAALERAAAGGAELGRSPDLTGP